MDKNVAIKVENASKKFCKKLKQSMFYGVKDIGKNMAGLKSNSDILRPDEFWAVKDVSFEVKKGEALGIIGPNGSGKTTILKMLNGIFWPDKGKISIRGKIGALIAVGAGFHPVLTGRENIYLNGAILGMGRHEINKKFDAIVDFADIGNFLDTPVKHYSSGMYVRLGFAIAAHCNPDILLIDEVLAVGDISFQSKCLSKIKEFVAKGKTIIFISHQMHHVEKLCDRVILLTHGKAVFEGKAYEAIVSYRYKVNTIENNIRLRTDSGEISIVKVELINKTGEVSNEFKMGECVTIRIHYSAQVIIKNPSFSVAFYSNDGTLISVFDTADDCIQLGDIEGEGYVDLKFDSLDLVPNFYSFSTTIHKEGRLAYFDKHYKKYNFYIKGGNNIHGICVLKHQWKSSKSISTVFPNT